MITLDVVNIKCGGCEAQILAALSGVGLSDIKIDVANQQIFFDGDEKIAKEILTKMGYPPADSKEAKSFFKKAKSYVSCMIGKTKK
ncbi:heavy-metal-associated domain-containing protein [bacterium]|nr:heavy-metal-associated domain-containing protein [bacterium]MBT7087601.1 heavy-metal-associated domain-containing protein [bacterium]